MGVGGIALNHLWIILSHIGEYKSIILKSTVCCARGIWNKFMIFMWNNCPPSFNICLIYIHRRNLTNLWDDNCTESRIVWKWCVNVCIFVSFYSVDAHSVKTSQKNPALWQPFCDSHHRKCKGIYLSNFRLHSICTNFTNIKQRSTLLITTQLLLKISSCQKEMVPQSICDSWGARCLKPLSTFKPHVRAQQIQGQLLPTCVHVGDKNT